MIFVSDIRRVGIELDIHDFMRGLRRQARWEFPKGASKAAVQAAVNRRLAEGDVAMPRGLEFPPYLVIVGVSLFGISAPLAAAFAITLHLIHYIPGTLLGLAFAWSSGLKLGELRAAEESIDRPEQPVALGGTWTSQS